MLPLVGNTCIKDDKVSISDRMEEKIEEVKRIFDGPLFSELQILLKSMEFAQKTLEEILPNLNPEQIKVVRRKAREFEFEVSKLIDTK